MLGGDTQSWPRMHVLTGPKRQDISNAMDEGAYPAGEILITEGAKADCLYLLCSGVIVTRYQHLPLNYEPYSNPCFPECRNFAVSGS